MALTLQEKKEIISEVAAVAASAHSVVAAEYRGLTVAQLTTLRKNARKGGVYLRVVKNNLARIAVKDTAFECIQEGLTGPLVLAFSQEDPGSAARLIKDFMKDKANEKIFSLALSFMKSLIKRAAEPGSSCENARTNGPVKPSWIHSKAVSLTAIRARLFFTTRRYTPPLRAFLRSVVSCATVNPRYSAATTE